VHRTRLFVEGVGQRYNVPEPESLRLANVSCLCREATILLNGAVIYILRREVLHRNLTWSKGSFGLSSAPPLKPYRGGLALADFLHVRSPFGMDFEWSYLEQYRLVHPTK
jgi:hypothetical protein